jgi:hypothetical protein
MIQVPSVLDRPRFLSALDAMSDEEIEPIAAAHPMLRKCLVPVGAEVAPMATPPAPGPAKVREPKAGPVDTGRLRMFLVDTLDRFPKLRAEDYAAKTDPSAFGATAETIGPAVKKALEALVSSKAAYCEGEKRGRRYWLAVPTKQEEAAE